MTPQNTFGRHYGPLTIKRPKDYELDFAIEELVKRGYELIKRGFDPNDPNVFNYDQRTKTRPVNYAQDGVRGKYWAIMRKVEVLV
jgi:hypothetical protein